MILVIPVVILLTCLSGFSNCDCLFLQKQKQRELREAEKAELERREREREMRSYDRVFNEEKMHSNYDGGNDSDDFM